ncbi:D-alanyl-D-alanine carboxypeptidase/D-alanyl-D-alanine-endopeptidase [Nonomuraea typhae]|uniref:D-alanyl-D-alanine carboxypeptidase/D-alanyl-D-alanine-endopeptidase n=1 Tax=Nonomuraea typhae TaxID=2603600 RepID=UPI001FECC8B1|nr:D-alanyl-D-alanine carboxypeptidase [Nonomuraea typhae]
MLTRRSLIRLLGAASLASTGTLRTRPTLDARIQEIIGRPVFRGARWGMAFRALESGASLYAMNSEQLFISASAFKIFPAGTAFSALGAGHRFRTRVCRTGPVARGVLKGDLILVAGGDLLLGGRIQRDGRLALPDPDHTYNGQPLPGDPLRTLRELARRVAGRGLRRVEGRVLVDASLFREGRESVANGGMLVPVSPIMVNDNIVDVSVKPGARAGDPGVLRPSPDLERIVNEVVTTQQATRPLRFTADGRLTGDIALGGPERFVPYYVPSPVSFAEAAFTTALRDSGVSVGNLALPPGGPRTQLAEHLSPPLSEQVKPMLKVSSNLHTVTFPYLVGAVAGRDPDDAKAKGRELQRELFRQAGLDPDPPGAAEGRHTADFFVGFLAHMRRQPYFSPFRRALPTMGRDGTLADVQVNSPAAGRVHAKTGTAGTAELIAKTLAGYIRLPDSWIAFAALMEQEAGFELLPVAGEALGEIATAVYEEALS